jgi:hypothetical protein
MFNKYNCDKFYPELSISKDDYIIIENIIKNKKINNLIKLFMEIIGSGLSVAGFLLDGGFLFYNIFSEKKIDMNLRYIANLVISGTKFFSHTMLGLVDFDNKIKAINPDSNFIDSILNIRFETDFQDFEKQLDMVINNETAEYSAFDFLALWCSLVEYVSSNLVTKDPKVGQLNSIEKLLLFGGPDYIDKDKIETEILNNKIPEDVLEKMFLKKVRQDFAKDYVFGIDDKVMEKIDKTIEKLGDKLDIDQSRLSSDDINTTYQFITCPYKTPHNLPDVVKDLYTDNMYFNLGGSQKFDRNKYKGIAIEGFIAKDTKTPSETERDFMNFINLLHIRETKYGVTNMSNEIIKYEANNGFSNGLDSMISEYNKNTEISFMTNTSTAWMIGSCAAIYPVVSTLFKVAGNKMCRCIFNEDSFSKLLDEGIGILGGLFLGKTYTIKENLPSELLKDFEKLDPNTTIFRDMMNDAITRMKVPHKKLLSKKQDINIIQDQEDIKKLTDEYQKLALKVRGAPELNKKETEIMAENIISYKENFPKIKDNLSKSQEVKGAYVGLMVSDVINTETSNIFKKAMHELLCEIAAKSNNTSRVASRICILTIGVLRTIHILSTYVIKAYTKYRMESMDNFSNICKFVEPLMQLSIKERKKKLLDIESKLLGVLY